MVTTVAARRDNKESLSPNPDVNSPAAFLGPGGNITRKISKNKGRGGPSRAATDFYPTTQSLGVDIPLHRVYTDEGLRSSDVKYFEPSHTRDTQSLSQQDPRVKRKNSSGSRRKAFIAVMGATGSGKTSFVNLVTGSNLEVSRALTSCTQLIALGSKLDFRGYEVNLIDTPGFDDTERSEVEILKTIAKYLQALHQNKIKLHGVIFLHRISDVRMSGSSRRSLQLFRAICGDKALSNTTIVTTMWDSVILKDAEKRERQLQEGEEFFKPFLRRNAKIFRHDKGTYSARHIISTMLQNKPCPLAIQIEMVNNHKLLLETAAGLYLSGEIQKSIQDLSDQLAPSEVTEENRTTLDGKVEGSYLDDDDEYERQELLKQLTRYRREMQGLEAEYRAEGDDQQNPQNLRRLRGDIARILRRWPQRFRKDGRNGGLSTNNGLDKASR